MASNRLKVVTKDECLALLRQASIGRVALTVRAMPEIHPVAFGLLDESVVFRAGRGTMLHAAARGTIVAFEADGFDLDAFQGWSVLVVGPAVEVTDPGEIATTREHLVGHWVPDDEDHVVRIGAHQISGRRIGPPS